MRIAHEAAQLPLLAPITRPLYRGQFNQLYHEGNRYYGRFDCYQAALAAVPPQAPSYDTKAAGRMYRGLLDDLRLCDYPALHWLSKLFSERPVGEKTAVFDLGGHVGIVYYAFRRYLDYPAQLRWTVHDVSNVIEAGRNWAAEHDAHGQLDFAAAAGAADGQDVLFTSGALQYLDYTLPELLGSLRQPPSHVLVNLLPMHPTRGYFTLQNMGFAICPYRVMAAQDFIDAMAELGYSVIDRWDILDRNIHVPFEPQCTIGRYTGMYLRRTHDAADRS
ncbi:MAG: methyltransferase, TIGR04325 family [Pseudomonadota bacterium]|nr:methyltransferase, TIGR04325 family [Pseudomonadota bacterium]